MAVVMVGVVVVVAWRRLWPSDGGDGDFASVDQRWWLCGNWEVVVAVVRLWWWWWWWCQWRLGGGSMATRGR